MGARLSPLDKFDLFMTGIVGLAVREQINNCYFEDNNNSQLVMVWSFERGDQAHVEGNNIQALYKHVPLSCLV